MAEEEELLDEEAAIDALNAALTLQYRSALQYSLVSAGVIGVAAQSVASLLVSFGDEELADTRALIEKIVALGGEPTTDVAALKYSDAISESLGWLIDSEADAIEALQQAIEPTGREGRSEALEHMLEHMIMRKQRQVDLLIRARRGES